MTTEPYRDFNPYTDRIATDFMQPYPTSWENILSLPMRTAPRIAQLTPLSIPYPIVLDVNHWVIVDLAIAQGTSKIAGVIIKLTEGTDFLDPAADAYIRTAWDLKIPFGVFHFMRRNKSGDDQARWFLDNVEQYRSLTGGKMIYDHLDCETADGVGNETGVYRTYKCATTIQQEWKTPGIYTNLNGFNTLFHINNQPPVWTNDLWWWWAHWTSALAPYIPLAIAKARVGLWQNGIAGSGHTWITPIAGAKVVDHGYDLLEVTKQPETPPPPPPPPPPPDDLTQRVDDLEDNLNHAWDQIMVLEAQVAALQSGLDATKTITNAADVRSRVNVQAITELVKNITTINEEIAGIRRFNNVTVGRLDEIENRISEAAKALS